MNGSVQRRRRACRRFGWTWLLAWAAVGLGLESMHGFKVGAYLDDELTRELLVLAHAHGVGLALVVIVWGEAGTPLFGERSDGGAGPALRLGAAIVPTALALSAFEHPEADPNPIVWAVPGGALLVLYALGRTAQAAWMRPPDDTER